MKSRRALPRQRVLASALLLALTQGAYAQTADAPATTQEEEPIELDRMVVTGIRGSLISSANLKRNAQGVVDGIVAEDIGKFPDTNLAESLQRISGVSIDRQLGEGSKVTVRGVGPDFNLVLLNGRQMPASSTGPGGSGVSNSRAFDFANLASEAISAVEVYKTSRAETPTGGIGATINIKTSRPLDVGALANIGVKAVHDTSNGNLPDSLQGEDYTPEVSGIYSWVSADEKFGVALNGSYQERDFGFSQASVPNGWRGPFRGDENNWGTIPQPGQPGSERITNRPGPDDLYQVPQNINYSVTGVQRQRTNGQLTLQWAPTDRLTTTLDYTYSENKIQQQRNELSVWFNFGPSTSTWSDGPLAAPLLYSELLTCTNESPPNDVVSVEGNVCPAGYRPNFTDLSMGGAQFATRNENKSLGFNAKWEATDSLDLEFDYHDSSAESGPDSANGSGGVLGMSAYIRGRTTVDLSGDFPIVSVQLPPGRATVLPSDGQVSGSVFPNSQTRSEIEQGRINGRWEFGESSGLDFGVSATEANNRTAYGFNQRDTWGGVGSPADYDDSIFTVDSMGRYFDQFSGNNSAAFTDTFLLFDFEALRRRAAELSGLPDLYRAPTEFSQDLRTEEKSRSAFLQYTTSFDDWRMPLNIAAGVRYEKTEVSSSALVPIANTITWLAANEFRVDFGERGFTTLEGEYDYWLPSLDLSLELTDEMILRGSYGQTIGRPGWADIQGGQTLDSIARVDGGTGRQGNPALEPLLSDNFDLSFEWYYDEGSYASVGYFRKNIDNYIGVTQFTDTPFDLRTPVGGAYWNQALASGCASTDVVCIRNFILNNLNGQPGVNRTGTDGNGNAEGTIIGQPADPIANFRITSVANQQSATLDGWEFNLQHVFGDSGFGVSANYTIVDSNISYDNNSIGEQFAIEGLSDSANLVAFYDKGPWQIRAAYNWRDEFLSGRFDGAGPNPAYTEAYGQLDVNASYEFNDRFTVFLEGINLTDETIRIHGRRDSQLLFATQTGPRYMAGFRYKFF